MRFVGAALPTFPVVVARRSDDARGIRLAQTRPREKARQRASSCEVGPRVPGVTAGPKTACGGGDFLLSPSSLLLGPCLPCEPSVRGLFTVQSQTQPALGDGYFLPQSREMDLRNDRALPSSDG